MLSKSASGEIWIPYFLYLAISLYLAPSIYIKRKHKVISSERKQYISAISELFSEISHA